MNSKVLRIIFASKKESGVPKRNQYLTFFIGFSKSARINGFMQEG